MLFAKAPIAAAAAAMGTMGAASVAEPPSSEPTEPPVGDPVQSRASESDPSELPVTGEAPNRSGPPAPLGVRMGEPLEGDRVRLSYRFERIHRRGMLVGGDHQSPSEVRDKAFWNYTEIPRSQDISVHTFELAYAPHPRITLVAEMPVVVKDLERFDENDNRYHHQTEGVGDVGFYAIVPFIRKGLETSHVHFGFDAPTGSIRRGDTNPGRAPYDLQIGNGSVDLEWGWTYRGAWRFVSWGGQATGRHPLDKNGLGYREGSRFNASMWGATRLLWGLSASLRFGWEKQNNIRSRDKGLDPISEPSANAKARGGDRLDLSPGIALDLPQLFHQRLSVEVDLPVYQHLDGPQLERDWVVRAGWQWIF